MNLDWSGLAAAVHSLQFLLPLAAGLPLGVGLGLACAALVSQRRRAELKVYAALWEWGRQRPDGGAGHARRIQGYYRHLRSWRPPGELLAGSGFWLACGLGVAAGVLRLAGAGGASSADPAVWGLYGLGAAAGAGLVVAQRLAGVLIGVAGMVVVVVLLVGITLN